ncbi:MAG: ATP-binding protein [Chrysiogenales bacterium]|nr:MAG: ATP-binding protein [Chrysiogenales bacterium]
MVKQKKTNILDESYPSDLGNRKDIIDSICTQIAADNIAMAITTEELYLSLDEAITNAMEHGNRWNNNKRIHVTISVDSNEIVIAISDEGNGFDTKDIEASLRKRDLLSTRGRGIYIINQFCKISWNDRGNQINLRIPRRK